VNITVLLGTQYVDCQFVWHLIQEDYNMQSLSALLKEHSCCILYTCFVYSLPSLFGSHNLKETHQYLLTMYHFRTFMLVAQGLLPLYDVKN